MNNFRLTVPIFVAIACLFVDPIMLAADSGTITLRCEGDAQHNDDPFGSNSGIRNAHQEGNAVVDFDRRQFQFMDWGWVPLTTLNRVYISGKLGSFDNDTNLANIELNRMSGEAYFQYWVHDHNQKVFWYRHIFAGKCVQAGKKF